MSSPTGGIFGFSGCRKPAESRRWLKPRVPREQLYRLGAPPTAPEAFRRHRILRTRASRVACLVGVAGGGCRLQWAGRWPYAIAAGCGRFLPVPCLRAIASRSVSDRWGPRRRTGRIPEHHRRGDRNAVSPGNHVTIFNNGDEFYPAMLEAIESAKQSITMEQYIYWDGQVGRRFAEAFAEKARQGVESSCYWMRLDRPRWEKRFSASSRLEDASWPGSVPFTGTRCTDANRRDHRKSLIMDGRIAFTGGAGLGDHWLGSAANCWRMA